MARGGAKITEERRKTMENDALAKVQRDLGMAAQQLEAVMENTQETYRDMFIGILDAMAYVDVATEELKKARQSEQV